MHPPMRHALPPSPAALSESAYSRFSDELKEQAHKEYLASLNATGKDRNTWSRPSLF